MKFTKLLQSLALAATLLVAVPATSSLQAAENDGVVRVVYPLDFPDVKRVHFMLNTLNNLIKHFQSTMTEYKVDVVVYGPGLQYAMHNFQATGFVGKPYLTHGGPTGKGTQGRFLAIKQLAGDNFDMFVCNNTMKKKHVTAKQLHPYAKVTPGGILKLIELQQKGASYIKIK